MAVERVRTVQKEKHKVYLEKAREFHNAMNKAAQDEEWNAAALNAIHCAISSADAVTVFYLGLRSTGQNHNEVTQLLSKTGLDSVQEKIKQFTDVVRMKTLVEYDAQEPTENEVKRVLTQADRFYQ